MQRPACELQRVTCLSCGRTQRNDGPIADERLGGYFGEWRVRECRQCRGIFAAYEERA